MLATSCAATGSTSGRPAANSGIRCTGGTEPTHSARPAALWSTPGMKRASRNWLPRNRPTTPPGLPIVVQSGGRAQPGSDLFLHERVARWNGWSLSVQRPGAAINRAQDPARSVDPDPTLNQPRTPFKMVATFTPVPGACPSCALAKVTKCARTHGRRGGQQRSARAATPPGAAAPAGTALPYLHFKPLPHPVLLLREPLQPGASLDRLVIRSYNTDESLDRVPATEVDQRHVVPPQAAVRHG